MAAQPVAADAVVKDPDRHPAPRRRRQPVAHRAADDVVADGVGGYKNVALGPVDGAEDRIEGIFAVDQQLAGIAAQKRYSGQPFEGVDAALVDAVVIAGHGLVDAAFLPDRPRRAAQFAPAGDLRREAAFPQHDKCRDGDEGRGGKKDHPAHCPLCGPRLLQRDVSQIGRQDVMTHHQKQQQILPEAQ